MPMKHDPFDKLMLASALDHVPFAALLFLPDDQFTLLWRNAAHERMTRTPDLRFVGQGMFEAFAPNDKDDAAAAKSAILSAVACQRR